jgi:hypothetical protein
MRRPLPRPALALGLGLVLAACGVQGRYEAAEEIHGFFAAAERGDRAELDRRVDWAALRENFRAELARQSGREARLLSQAVSGPHADAVLKRMVSPESFRLVAQGAGAAGRRMPTTLELAVAITLQDETHACLSDGRKPPGCVLSFAKRPDGWKLVALSMQGIQIGATR